MAVVVHYVCSFLFAHGSFGQWYSVSHCSCSSTGLLPFNGFLALRRISFVFIHLCGAADTAKQKRLKSESFFWHCFRFFSASFDPPAHSPPTPTTLMKSRRLAIRACGKTDFFFGLAWGESKVLFWKVRHGLAFFFFFVCSACRVYIETKIGHFLGENSSVWPVSALLLFDTAPRSKC